MSPSGRTGKSIVGFVVLHGREEDWPKDVGRSCDQKWHCVLAVTDWLKDLVQIEYMAMDESDNDFRDLECHENVRTAKDVMVHADATIKQGCGFGENADRSRIERP
jgi:hypothetical protein